MDQFKVRQPWPLWFLLSLALGITTAFTMDSFRIVISPEAASRFTALATLISAIAIIGTAIFASMAIQHARFVEQLKLTNEVLNADYTFEATNNIVVLLTRHGLDLKAARAEIENTTSVEGNERARRAVGVFWYLSSLYARGALDNPIVIATASFSIVQAYYLYEKTIKQHLKLGLYPRSLLKLAIDSNEYLKKNPAVYLAYRDLEGLVIEP